MKNISKKTAHRLNKEYGIPFKDGGISVSSNRRNYGLCESERNLRALSKIEGNTK